MTEELATHEFRREGRAIDNHECPLGRALVEIVDGLGNEFFPGSALTDDRHSRRREGRDFDDLPLELLPDPRFPDQPGQRSRFFHDLQNRTPANDPGDDLRDEIGDILDDEDVTCAGALQRPEVGDFERMERNSDCQQ